ncbi:hypothetical protein Tco_0840050 [Tanacetum coccineum]|uniref:Protein FAR1-RELATED SEQUENCE n=1 Tax=Tanacetum coccineum TaxID=301880 RepID=A0ABQ5ATA7_9ASTR
MEVIKQIDLNKNIVEDDNDLESKKEDVMKEDAYIEAVAEEMTDRRKIDEDDLMNVMEVSKQIEVSNVDDNLTVESDGIEQQIDLNKDIIEQQNVVKSDGDGIDDVLEVADRCRCWKILYENTKSNFINKMKNRKIYVLNFTFQYRVENSELVSMFWDDEVAKCNYKEFENIVSFDATFNNNK